MKKDDFFFRKTDQEDFVIYDVFIKGVNCRTGIEKPIGTIEIITGLYDRLVKISITEVYLTLEEHSQLLQIMKECLKLTSDEKILFAA